MKFSILIRKTHRLLALTIGIQILLWTLSGLVMSYFPINEIRSQHLLKKHAPLIINDSEKSQLKPIHKILNSPALQNKGVKEVRLKRLVGQLVFETHLTKGEIEIFNAISGERLSPITEDFAKKIIHYQLNHPTPIKSIELLEKDPPIEYRGRLPVWRANLANEDNSSFYISLSSGKVVARRSTLWRIYDFFWMLHIMDYWERDNFNSWWLILAAILGVLASFTGVILLKYSFRIFSRKRQ